MDFDTAAWILGMDDRTTDDSYTGEYDGPTEVPADATTWELRIFSDRPVFNLARIIREIDPLYTVEIIER